ncbi:MAG: tol-pal system YbgF family protein [Pyrinomonadaceae bacterium]
MQGVVAVSAQTNPVEQSNEEVRPFTDLTLEIVVPERTVLSLQPIPIVIRQSNKTNQLAMGYKAIVFGFTPFRLFAKKIGSNEKVPIGRQSALLHYAVFFNVKLAPGESCETKGWITIGLHRYFPEPGTYEIQAGLTNNDGSQYIESNKVTVEIKMPTGADHNAYNLIKNNSFEDFLFSGHKFDKAKGILETLTVTHPNTPYAKSASFLLGESHFNQKQYQQALKNLIRLENDRDFIFADKVRDYIDEIQELLQQQTVLENQ